MAFLPDRVFDLYRRWFGRWSLRDPRPTAAEAPYTFHLPTAEQLAALGPGDLVKLIFEGFPASRDFGAERMWVKITQRRGGDFEGLLDNHPSDLPQMRAGMPVRFQDWHVIDTDFADPELDRRLASPDRPWVWERCLVDDTVINGEARVGYFYRERPDMMKEDDKQPDSGWRFRAEWGPQETEAEYDARTASYVAIGVVLNGDPSLEPMISAPEGTRFWRGEDGAWVRE